MSSEEEIYLISVDKKTYDLIKQYRAENSPASQPFTMEQISFSAQMMIQGYIKEKKNISLAWALGVAATVAFGVLAMPPETWFIFDEPFSIGTIIFFIIVFFLNLFLGLIVGLLLGAFDSALKNADNIECLPNKIKQSLFPSIVLAVLFIIAILYHMK